MCAQRSTRKGNVKEHKESYHKVHFVLVITAEMNHDGNLVSKLTRGQCTKNSCHYETRTFLYNVWAITEPGCLPGPKIGAIFEEKPGGGFENEVAFLLLCS